VTEPRPQHRRLLRRGRRLVARSLGVKIAAACAAALFCLLCFVGLFVASAPTPADQSTPVTCTSSGAHGQIPADYFPWLPEAAAKYLLGSRGASIVAAIHYIESDWDQSPLPGVAPGTQNSAGAEGPGQFLISSWAAYGVDANGDGRADPYSIPDSVFATARLLHADGAPKDWRAAIFDYNHADWYVEEVLAKAASLHITAACTPATGPLGPLPTQRLARLGYVARWIESRQIHYCWGGGHAAQPGPSPGTYCWSASGEQIFGAREAGLDCSGAVRWLLVLSGYPDPGGLVSNELGAHYPAGLGKAVTIWSNADHVWIEINGRDWGTTDSNFAHGPGFGRQTTEGFVPSHLPDL
jgi:hypothetical protein